MDITNNIVYFWEHVIKHDEGCWGWVGCKSKYGYGRIRVDHCDLVASRMSWMIHFGEIPEGLWILHHCDNPECTRPEHLFLGTAKDNAQDCLAKGRHKSVRGENVGVHKLTWEQVRQIRKDYTPVEVSCYTLAKKYGVSHDAIWKIVTNRRWLEGE